MKIRIVAVGGKMPDWVQTGFQEYARRIPQEFGLQLIEVPLGQRSKSQPAERAVAAEGEAMLRAIPDGDRVIALDVRGKPLSTEMLADQIRDWQLSGDNFSLLIGGPDGLARTCLDRADIKWSLSAMTLPHPLVRVMLAEQLYRAWSITANHPYHK